MGPASPARRSLLPVSGPTIDLTIANSRLMVGGQAVVATAINGGIPGPEIRLREGQDVHLRVTNRLDETSSIHWHGLLVPAGMDGVPGLSYAGIRSGTTFDYRFPIRQAGTYWYHSHSGLQEQTGVYGPLVIEPKTRTEAYDHDLTVLLSDWTYDDPHSVLANLKRYPGYYNYQRGTLANLGESKGSVGDTISERLRWSKMRMDATDISDITGVTYTYLMNGLSPTENWRSVVKSGQRVRLRVINASAATYFDVRIPGLPMTVVASDGMPVKPVEVEEFRIAVAETFDVIVTPTAPSYTIFAEAMDRSGYARGTLATDAAVTGATIPKRRKRPLLTMTDMGMDHGGGDHTGMAMPDKKKPPAADANDHSGHGGTMAPDKEARPEADANGQAGHGGMAMPMPNMAKCTAAAEVVFKHGPDEHGPGNAMVAKVARARLSDPGVGLRDAPWKVLTYSDLRRATPGPVERAPSRTIELHLTGNMERYMWSFDGVQFRSDTPPIVLRHNERVRFVLINDTMMAHPIHLHGMFFELEVGACENNPLKHTVNVQPGERTSFVVTADEIGRWAFHCHILYHMEAGMFRVVEVRA